MKTFFKGLAVLVGGLWTAGGAIMPLWEVLVWLGGSGDRTWTPSDTGWWQLLIYGALIGWALFFIYTIIMFLGELVEDK